MEYRSSMWLLLLCLAGASVIIEGKKGDIHRETFLSPGFELGPGDVTDTFHNLEFPDGQVTLRSFEAEVVDEEGKSVPLTDIYLHHWVVFKVNVKKGYKQLLSSEPRVAHVDPASNEMFDHTNGASMSNRERMQFHPEAHPQFLQKQGTCNDESNGAFFMAMGSETRHTNSTIPAPYGIVTGDTTVIPEGYEEAWYLNIHGIDTRGAVSAKSCLECLCESYGVTVDRNGRPISKDYKGGLYCCYDKTHCAVKSDFSAPKRKVYLKYTMNLVETDETVKPVRMYGFDATDGRTSLEQKAVCKVEYEVKQCNDGTPKLECVDRRATVGAVPQGGFLVRGVAHQHVGALGTNLYRKDGTLLCSSNPIYGHGTVAGDEAGYLVGMTTCYPQSNTVYIEAWEELILEAFYSSSQSHTGVMSVFTVLLADAIIEDPVQLDEIFSRTASE